jgi:hypothetical protein
LDPKLRALPALARAGGTHAADMLLPLTCAAAASAAARMSASGVAMPSPALP